jgi:cytochrome c553/enamine deaminase RidA (YjgF/YER057c/UK114 family)
MTATPSALSRTGAWWLATAISIVAGLTAAHGAETGTGRSASMLPDEVRFEQCLVCHGTYAAGNAAVPAPALNMLPAWYVRAQLLAYRSGVRGSHPDDDSGHVMQSVAAVLTDAQIDAAADFVTGYPLQPGQRPADTGDDGVGDDLARGRQLYGACAGCHGERTNGNEALAAPPLAGQAQWYLSQQLQHYRDGIRGAHPDDRWGAAMQMAAQALPSPEHIADVVAYIGALANGPTRMTNTMESDAMKLPMRETLPAAALALGMATGIGMGGDATAADIVRYPLPNNSTFPIALAVETPPGTTLIHHSGLTPRPVNPDAKKGSRWYWGDTKTQAMSVFGRMQTSLEGMGLGFGDVIKMTVFLVGDEELGGRMDFGGFMEAYTQFFGTEEQPNLPARSAVQVAGLAADGMMVEIEVILARPAP